MKYNKDSNVSTFKLNYRSEKVKFRKKIFSKKEMSLKEFSLVVLGIEPISKEIIAMYIGKMVFSTYNKGSYKITITKKTKNGIRGIININMQ